MSDFNLVRDIAIEKYVGLHLRFCERSEAKPMGYDDAVRLATRKYGKDWATHAQIVPASYHEYCSYRSWMAAKQIPLEKRIERAHTASMAAKAMRARKWFSKSVKLRVAYRPKQFVREKNMTHKVAVCATGIRTAARLARKVSPHGTIHLLKDKWSKKKPMGTLPDQDGVWLFVNEQWIKVL